MISQEDFNFITWLDNSTPDQRQQLLKEKPYQVCRFISGRDPISHPLFVSYGVCRDHFVDAPSQ